MTHGIQTWAGHVFGTNTGNLYLEFTETQGSLLGQLKLLDDRHGIFVFDVEVILEEGKLDILGQPSESPNAEVGTLRAQGALDEQGSFAGRWNTTGGYGGTFELYSHNQVHDDETSTEAGNASAQLFMKRQVLGLISIDREGLVELGQLLSKEVANSRVIVTVESETQHTMFLADFANQSHGSPAAKLAKLYVQCPEGNGLNRVLSIEFGQEENVVFAQSSDESWAVGVVDRVTRSIRKFELPSALRFARLGVGVNQVLFLGMIAYLPSIDSLQVRVLYVVGIVTIMFALREIHNRLVPVARVSLSPDNMSAGSRTVRKLSSWIIGIICLSLAAYFSAKIDSVWAFLEAVVYSIELE